MMAAFNRFVLELPQQAVYACSHSGPCDSDVDRWAALIPRPPEITPENLSAELKEYGAWNDDELQDDTANWKRLIWLAAGYIQENRFVEELAKQERL